MRLGQALLLLNSAHCSIFLHLAFAQTENYLWLQVRTDAFLSGPFQMTSWGISKEFWPKCRSMESSGRPTRSSLRTPSLMKPIKTRLSSEKTTSILSKALWFTTIGLELITEPLEKKPRENPLLWFRIPDRMSRSTTERTRPSGTLTYWRKRRNGVSSQSRNPHEKRLRSDPSGIRVLTVNLSSKAKWFRRQT